jgi:Holliday junction DNA helicase RuvA
MIEFVEGRLEEVHPTHVVVLQGGIGLRLHISLSTFSNLGAPGGEIRLLTHLYVRDNEFELYGFSTELERTLFRLLIGVSGIGPRSAVGILSAVQPSEFRRAMLSADLDRLVAVPGIGRKTAQRLMVELKDKLEAMVSEEEMAQIPSGDGRFPEAVDALMALGYPKHSAEKAVQKCLSDQPDLSLEDLVRQALSRFR